VACTPVLLVERWMVYANYQDMGGLWHCFTNMNRSYIMGISLGFAEQYILFSNGTSTTWGIKWNP
jgi:hypothetical protein